MALSGYFIDANLLVLLVVGSVGRELIAKHRRLQEYTVEDYDALLDLLEGVESIFVTPNTLTEASNLIGQHGQPERSRFFARLRFLIENSREVVISSRLAASNANFGRLGLTDAALIEAVTEDTPLLTTLTTDFILYVAAMRKSRNAPTAINFLRFRDL